MTALPAMLFAQSLDTLPAPGAPRPFVTPVPHVETLDNGLRVVVASRRTLPLVTIQLLVRSGAETDPPALAGLADLTAGLLTKGTTTRSATQIADAAEALGGELASGAGWDRSQVSLTVTRPHAAAALALVADVVLHPRFAARELARARRQAQDHLAVTMGDPGSLARLAVDRAAFGDGAFGHPAGGTPGSLARMTRGDIVAQHQAWYRPDNATLILTGDLDADEARWLAVAAFGAWARPAAALPAAGVDGTRRVAPASVVLTLPDAGQAGIALAAPTIARDAADYHPGVIANAILGGGYSSRLNQELRIRRGLTYGVGSSLDARRGGGVWRIAAQTKNASVAEFVQVTLDEVARMSTSAPSAAELEARKMTVIGAVSRRYETTASLAGVIAGFEATGIAPAEMARTVAALEAVTADDVLAFARTHWDPAALAIVVAGDASVADALRTRHPGLRVVASDALDLDRADLTRATPAARPSSR
ncbi:MAG: insulinase family protein [Burkholderiales bacterium]|nr:insulinase family protein [Burkholderiales bacterium]